MSAVQARFAATGSNRRSSTFSATGRPCFESVVTRNFLFEVGDEIGVDVRYETLVPADLESVDEAFITSTTRELSPVTRIDDRPIGNGKAGPVTRQLLDAYRRRAYALTQALVEGRR